MTIATEPQLLQDLFGLTDRVAVVTGGGGKLGPIWIHALLEAGATVVALDRPPFQPGPVLQELLDRHGEKRLRLLDGDVRDRDALKRALEDTVAEAGVPHVLVNNAGIDSPPSPSGKSFALDEIPFEINRDILEVNTLGAFLVTQVFGAKMAEAGRGSIINIGSLYASVSPNARFYDHIPGFLKPPAYGASKAALVNLTKYLATAWGPRGVRVNALSPGGVLGGQDPQFLEKFCACVPLGRMAEARDLWGPMLFLASDASSYVTGTELKVEGGFTAW